MQTSKAHQFLIFVENFFFSLKVRNFFLKCWTPFNMVIIKQSDKNFILIKFFLIEFVTNLCAIKLGVSALSYSENSKLKFSY